MIVIFEIMHVCLLTREYTYLLLLYEYVDIQCLKCMSDNIIYYLSVLVSL